MEGRTESEGPEQGGEGAKCRSAEGVQDSGEGRRSFVVFYCNYCTNICFPFTR